MAVNTTSVAIASSVIEFLTVMVTLFRLSFRLRIRRLWWEDMWAAVAMVGAMVFAIVNLIYFQTKSFRMADITQWISSYAFTGTVWSARMSLLYSIVRVISPSTRLRKFIRAIGALFIAVWASLLALKTSWCENNSGAEFGRPTCSIPHSTAIFEVTADFVGDAILVILSVRFLRRVKLPRRQRRMILLVFSSSSIISTSSLLHAIAQINFDQELRTFFANLELILSLVVCNLLVVVTYIYRVYVRPSASEPEDSLEDDDDFTTPVSRNIRSLTTVDLNTPDPTTVGLPLATLASRSSF